MVVKLETANGGVRAVGFKQLDVDVPGLGSHLRRGSALPPGVQFVPSTALRRRVRAWSVAAVVGMAVFGSLAFWGARVRWPGLLTFSLGLLALVVAVVPGLRRAPRLGLYLTPRALVAHSAGTGYLHLIPYGAVTEMHAQAGRRPSRSTVSVTARFRMGRVRTATYGPFDAPPHELDATLEQWARRGDGTDAHPPDDPSPGDLTSP